MISLLPGLYLTIHQFAGPHAPMPLPLDSGFSTTNAYLALGAFSMSESGEAFFILSNDRDEVWFISNRHLRTHTIDPAAKGLRIAISGSRMNRAPANARKLPHLNGGPNANGQTWAAASVS